MDYVQKVYRAKVRYEDAAAGIPLVVETSPPQNIVQRLQTRELFNGRRVGTSKYLERSMCQSVYPNFTVTSIEKPSCYLRKFTPDGKYLLAFSADQVSVEIYQFNGPEAAVHMFELNVRASDEEWPTAVIGETSQPDKVGWAEANMIGPEHQDTLSEHIRDHMFDVFFSLQHTIMVAPLGEQLNRECSLFTEDSRYLIVGSTSFIQDEFYHPTVQEIYRNNESVEPNSRFPLENYSIHILDLHCGECRDEISYQVDKIILSHNQGIYLYKQTLAILSVQHQTIRIFRIEEGKFKHMQNIGRFCYDDDNLFFQSTPEFRPNITAYEDKNINALKHRILSYVYRQAYIKFTNSKDCSGLLQFHKHFDQLNAMRLWKMQLLDEDNLFLKYALAEVVTLKIPEPNAQYCLFVIYCISSTEVLAVYDNNSDELVDLFESFTDNFRNNFLTEEARYCSSPSNNMFSKEIHENFRQTITSARFGGPAEATKRILTQLPISAQSYSTSPYLDQALFSYDDHRVSIMERPKAPGEIPIRFFGRESGLFKFQMYAGIAERAALQTGRRLVAFTFHPTAPFAISIQRANLEFDVNFHFRLDASSCLYEDQDEDS